MKLETVAGVSLGAFGLAYLMGYVLGKRGPLLGSQAASNTGQQAGNAGSEPSGNSSGQTILQGGVFYYDYR